LAKPSLHNTTALLRFEQTPSRLKRHMIFERSLSFHWHPVNYSFFKKKKEKQGICFDSIPLSYWKLTIVGF